MADKDEKLREQIASKIKPHLSDMCPRDISGMVVCPDHTQKSRSGIESCKYCVADRIIPLIQADYKERLLERIEQRRGNFYHVSEGASIEQQVKRKEYMAAEMERQAILKLIER